MTRKQKVDKWHPETKARTTWLVNEMLSNNWPNLRERFCEQFACAEYQYYKHLRIARPVYDGKIDVRNQAVEKASLIAHEDGILKNLLTRNEALEILSNMARGESVNSIKPTSGDQRQAIETVAKMEGWFSAEKAEISVSQTSLNATFHVVVNGSPKLKDG